MSWHIAETREQARSEAGDGLMRWHNEYNARHAEAPGRRSCSTTPDEAVDADRVRRRARRAVIGTPDDLVAAIRKLHELTGGFGTVIGFAHDWANRENTMRSWDLVARYVIPEVNGMLDGTTASRASTWSRTASRSSVPARR